MVAVGAFILVVDEEVIKEHFLKFPWLILEDHIYEALEDFGALIRPKVINLHS